MTARSSAAVSPSPTGSSQDDNQADQQDSLAAGVGESRQSGMASETSSSRRDAISMSEAAARFQVCVAVLPQLGDHHAS